MSDYPVEKGKFIFEQWEQGDTFYVLITGEAQVMRRENAHGGERVIAELKPGSYFGERALLKNDVRYASIRAKTTMHTLSITRAAFERVLGQLADLVPDHY